MKKIPVLLLMALLLLAPLSGCGGGTGATTPAPTPTPTETPTPTSTEAPTPTETPTPTPEPIDTASALDAILLGANDLLADEDKMGMTFTDPVTADNSQGMLGLTAEEFGEYAVSAYTSNAAIISIAHEIALIECADDSAAAKVKELVANGFDSLRWICVFPDHSLVVSSGKYVMLAATRDNFSDAAVASFASYMGGAGDPDVFYTSPEIDR